MRRKWILSGLMMLVALLASACSSTAHPISSGPAPTSSVPAKSVPPSPSTTPTTVKTVPIDQIPPGAPTSWVPEGVPTKARYAQRGDAVARFTPAMFGNDQDGAIATAQYYLAAQNWSLALNDNRPVDVVCVAQRCQLSRQKFDKLRGLKEHIVGGRIHPLNPQIKLATISNGSKWLYQVNVDTAAYRVVDASNNTVDSYPAHKGVLTNIFLKWAGKLWSISLQTSHR